MAASKNKEVKEILPIDLKDLYNPSLEAFCMADVVIDQLCVNGGMFLYEQYLETKDVGHSCKRLIQFLGEAIQVQHFPGDPGEDESETEDLWGPDEEAEPAVIDTWTRYTVQTKQIVKVDNTGPIIDDPPSSRRSKKANSIMTKSSFRARSKKVTAKKDAIETGSTNSKKENLNLNLNISAVSQEKQTRTVPLDVEPPREIPETERLLRDRKLKQDKVKEAELKERLEKEERDKKMRKALQEELAEIENKPHTYDSEGNIMLVGVPNVQKMPKFPHTLGFQVDEEEQKQNTDQRNRNQYAVRIKTKKIAKVPDTGRSSKSSKSTKFDKTQKSEKSYRSGITEQQKTESQQNTYMELPSEKQAKKDLQSLREKMYEVQQETLKDFGLHGEEGLEIDAGVVMIEENNRKVKGPPMERGNRMTILEYQRVSQDFQLQNQNQDDKAEEIKVEVIDEEESSEEEKVMEVFSPKANSPDKLFIFPGAGDMLQEEMSKTQKRNLIRSMRKGMVSANIKNLNQRMVDHHHSRQHVRLLSAKSNPKTDTLTKTSSRPLLHERVYNYEGYLDEVGMQDIPKPVIPQLNLEQESARLSVRGSIKGSEKPQYKEHLKNPTSMIDEFNKILLGKGDGQLPLIGGGTKQKQRPQTGKPQTITKSVIPIVARRLMGNKETFEVESKYESNKSTKQPRERIISGKLPKNRESLAQPPLGKTMGHGLFKKADSFKSIKPQNFKSEPSVAESGR